MRVLVTRQREQAEPLVDALAARGFDAVVEPLICTQSLSDAPIYVEGYDCVIVTSPNGARELARRREGRPAFLAAIGPGTAAALKQEGLEPDLTAAEHTQEGLVAAFDMRPRRALFVGAEGARSVLADELDAEFVAAYRTIERIPAELPDVRPGRAHVSLSRECLRRRRRPGSGDLDRATDDGTGAHRGSRGCRRGAFA